MQGVSRLPNSTIYVVNPGYLGWYWLNFPDCLIAFLVFVLLLVYFCVYIYSFSSCMTYLRKVIHKLNSI